MKALRKSAFTLIELLVVVAIIALLLSILLPSLSGAREQGKKAKCLANLGNLGKSVYQYANEDRAEQIIPIHMNMMQTCQYWEWRTINWFAWGGRSGQIPFLTAGSGGGWILDDKENPSYPGRPLRYAYAANRRPLNLYMMGSVDSGDQKRLEWFSCPSDTGYPDDPRIDDAPLANATRPCYDSIGNSYRGSLYCYTFAGQAQSPSTGHFAIGPWGHRISTLVDTGKLILAGEPTFFNMIGRDDQAGLTDEVPVLGWHKRKMMDNLLFCDGSARTTKAEKQLAIDTQGGWGDDLYREDLIHRGTTYRLDTYPVGGAIIWGDWGSEITSSGDKWPWKGFQDNLRK